jgi:hypothetical protein
MLKKLRGFGLRRKLVVFKYTLQRGYAWCQLPTLALIGAGVLKPYFPNWSIWSLGAIAMAVFLIAGIIDKAMGLLHEETNYGTEMSPLLMRGLKGELKGDNPQINVVEEKIVTINDKKEEVKKDEDKYFDFTYVDLGKPKFN